MEELQTQLDELRQANTTLQQQIEARNPCPAQEERINQISVKMPPFWRDKPSLWFSQVEAQFTLAGVTRESTKFAYVISNLDERYAFEVEDIIATPPVNTPYTILKLELIKRVSISEQQRIKQLLNEEELADRKPSQFLRHLRSLAGGNLAQEQVIRSLWFHRLPSYVQAILQTQADTVTLDNLAATADKILEVQPSSTPFVNSMSGTSPVGDLAQQLAELRTMFSSLQSDITNLNRRSRSRNTSPGEKPRHKSPSSSNNTSICWYHKRFGDMANKCIKPCAYKSTNSPGSK